MRSSTAEKYAEEWKEIEKFLCKKGYSRSAAHRAIAGIFGYSDSHVYNVTTPGAMEAARRRARDYHKRCGYISCPQRSSKSLIRRKAYNTKYVRTMRHMKDYTDYLLDQQESFELAELAEVLCLKSGIRPELKTLAKRLKKYGSKLGIEEYKAGRYQKVLTDYFPE